MKQTESILQSVNAKYTMLAKQMKQKLVLPQLASAKRGKAERTGIHAWFPYYAGYSEAFVASAIDYLGLHEGHLVLDPWNGSGTTGVVGGRSKLINIGIDVNPVMNLFAFAKSGMNTKNQELLRKLCFELVDKAESYIEPVQVEEPLLLYMSNSLCKFSKAYYRSSCELSYPDFLITPYAKDVLLAEYRSNPLKSFIQAALLITVKKLAGYKRGSNPTWLKLEEKKTEIQIEEFKTCFLSQIDQMLSDIQLYKLNEADNITSIALEADSRNMPIKSNSIDAVITSPPYLTRVDYAMATSPEFLLIRPGSEIRALREKTIGAPIIYDKNISPSLEWGETCNKVLAAITNHNTKAARSYYLPNILQYFRDIELSLREVLRTLKPHKRALVVVQSSYFKDIEIDLGTIYTEMAQNLGAKSDLANREYVRGHIAHVNVKSNRYKANKTYYEDVVMIEAQE